MFDIINGVKLCTWYKSRIILRLNMHDQISKYFRWKSILFMFLWGWFRNILKDKLQPHDVKAKCLFLKVTKYTFRNRPFHFTLTSCGFNLCLRKGSGKVPVHSISLLIIHIQLKQSRALCPDYLYAAEGPVRRSQKRLRKQRQVSSCTRGKVRSEHGDI